jgi:hypothetical protein
MFRWLRLVVMWLMAVAIPLQGFAASAISLCAPEQVAMMAGAVIDDGHANHRHVLESADGGAHIAHAPALPVASSADPDDQASGHLGHASHGVLKCCAACAMAAVMVPDLAARGQTRSAAPSRTVEHFYQGVILDGLDRPPRSLLA